MQPTPGNELTASNERYEFRVVCPDAQEVYLLGDFNGWSTTATPMVRTREHVWQVSLELPSDQPATGRGAWAQGARFGYFVIDKQWMTGSAALGNTYLLPGTWADVARVQGSN